MVMQRTLTERLKASWLRPLLVALFVCVASTASAADVVNLTSATGCCYPSGYSNQNYSVYGVAVPGCNPPPVYGVCGGSLWSCSSGTAANGNTSASAYTWQCLGSGGGTNASCSQSIPGTWSTGGWSSCSASCGGGTQTRSVTCSNGNCSSATQPASSQSCNTQSCYTGYWYASTGSCSASCGGGSQTVSYACSNGNCDPSTKPGGYSQSCNTQACAPTYTGSWVASTGSCSASCGGGTQTTSYSCSNGNCNPATKPGDSNAPCNTQACAPVVCVPTRSWQSSGKFATGSGAFNCSYMMEDDCGNTWLVDGDDSCS